MVDFSENISPLGLPETVRRAMTAAVDRCSCYPDPLCRELTAAIAKKEGVPPEWVLCGGGAAELMFRAVYARRPESALVLAPSFPEYEQALSSVPCMVYRHPLREEDGFRLTDSVLDGIGRVDTVFVGNPNNPTGLPVEPKLMEQVMELCVRNEALLVLDECCIEFLDEPERYTRKADLELYPNLLILRTFTKFYGMAGLRVGYALCSDVDLLADMTSCAQPWSVSVMAQAAAAAALADEEYPRRVRELIGGERDFLRRELGQLGLTVYDSMANFMLLRAPGRTDLRDAMQERGVLIRSCHNFAGLGGDYYRVAVRAHGENCLLVEALRACLGAN